MQHQRKEDKDPISRIIKEKKGISSIKDKRVRISKDFTFYGVTVTKSGDPEISLALKIIKESGEQLIIQYHEMISPMRYDGAGLIEFSTPYLSVKIEGKNLGDIIDYLAEHRLVWIKEPDSDFIESKDKEAKVERIEVTEK